MKGKIKLFLNLKRSIKPFKRVILTGPLQKRRALQVLKLNLTIQEKRAGRSLERREDNPKLYHLRPECKKAHASKDEEVPAEVVGTLESEAAVQTVSA